MISLSLFSIGAGVYISTVETHPSANAQVLVLTRQVREVMQADVKLENAVCTVALFGIACLCLSPFIPFEALFSDDGINAHHHFHPQPRDSLILGCCWKNWQPIRAMPVWMNNTTLVCNKGIKWFVGWMTVSVISVIFSLSPFNCCHFGKKVYPKNSCHIKLAFF